MNDDPLASLFLRHGQPASGPATESYSPYTAFSPRPLSPMIEFSLTTGETLALPYTCLLSLYLNPSEGITATFSTHVVTITGIHLREVFDAIRHHDAERVNTIQTRPARLSTESPTIFAITAVDRQ